MPATVEGGARRQNIYFVRETTNTDGDPITPSNPTFRLFSSVVETLSQESTPNFDERVGLGNVVAQDATRQQEDHELTVGYDLEQFPVDSNDNPQDAFADASLRNVDNQIDQTHSYLMVEQRASLSTGNTVHYKYFTEQGNTHPGTDPGATSLASRTEVYGRGGIVDEATLSFDPGDSAAAGVELSYLFRKIRSYQIDQPVSDYIHVRSTDSSDTGIDVKIESEDGSTSETITLDGTDATTPVGSSNVYDSLRVEVQSDPTGDIEVYDDDDSGSSAPGAPEHLLTVLRGTSSRGGVEADRGVPMVGTGSFQTVSGAGLGDALTSTAAGSITWEGHSAGMNIGSVTLTVSNEVATETTSEGLTKAHYAATQEITVEGSVWGETESPDKYNAMLEAREGEFVIPMADGDVRVPRAYLRDGGSTEREAGNAFMQVEVTWSALEPSTGDPLDFVHN